MTRRTALSRPRRPGRGVFVLPAVLSALAAGCAAPPPRPAASAATPPPRYQSVTTGPVARLVMRTQVEPAGAVYAVNVLTDTDACGARQTLGQGRTGSTALPSVNVAAARMTTVEFAAATADRKACMVRWSFLPVAGRVYLLQSSFDGSRCVSVVLDATNPDAIRPEPSALRRNPTPEQACVPIGQARALPLQTQGAGDATLAPGARNDDLKGLIGP